MREISQVALLGRDPTDSHVDLFPVAARLAHSELCHLPVVAVQNPVASVQAALGEVVHVSSALGREKDLDSNLAVQRFAACKPVVSGQRLLVGLIFFRGIDVASPREPRPGFRQGFQVADDDLYCFSRHSANLTG